jgi:hypothetical protein
MHPTGEYNAEIHRCIEMERKLLALRFAAINEEQIGA